MMTTNLFRFYEKKTFLQPTGLCLAKRSSLCLNIDYPPTRNQYRLIDSEIIETGQGFVLNFLLGRNIGPAQTALNMEMNHPNVPSLLSHLFWRNIPKSIYKNRKKMRKFHSWLFFVRCFSALASFWWLQLLWVLYTSYKNECLNSN